MSDKDETCWQAQQNENKPCENRECRLWLNCKSIQNCTIIAAQDGPRTLQEIGNLHELTRMRICQVEKEAIRKIKEIVYST